MNKLLKALVAAAIATTFAGCSSSPERDPAVIAQPRADTKYGVVQVGTRQNAELVFCDKRDCPQRTLKMLPIPQPPVVAVKEPSRYQVHFRWGSSALDSSGRKELDVVIASGALAKASSIIVAGRTDPTGSKKANERLALRRAQTVRATLIKSGVPESKITAEVQDPCCNGDLQATRKAMQQLRRTDIEITIK